MARRSSGSFDSRSLRAKVSTFKAMAVTKASASDQFCAVRWYQPSARSPMSANQPATAVSKPLQLPSLEATRPRRAPQIFRPPFFCDSTSTKLRGEV